MEQLIAHEYGQHQRKTRDAKPRHSAGGTSRRQDTKPQAWITERWAWSREHGATIKTGGIRKF